MVSRFVYTVIREGMFFDKADLGKWVKDFENGIMMETGEYLYGGSGNGSSEQVYCEMQVSEDGEHWITASEGRQ